MRRYAVGQCTIYLEALRRKLRSSDTFESERKELKKSHTFSTVGCESINGTFNKYEYTVIVISKCSGSIAVLPKLSGIKFRSR